MSQWPETNESLILRIRDPLDALAWSQFMAIYEPVVYRLARRRGLQHADSEELCQRVFLSVANAVENWVSHEDGEDSKGGRYLKNAVTLKSRPRVDTCQPLMLFAVATY